MFGVVTFHDAMVDWERQPLLLRLILFLVRKYVKQVGVFPDFLRVQTAKVVVHEGFNCLVNVINYAFQLVILVGVNLNVAKGDKNDPLKIRSAFILLDVERWRPSVSETWLAAWCVVGEPACLPFRVWEDNSSTGNWQRAATGQLLVASVQSCGRSRNTSRWRTNLSQQINFTDRNWNRRKSLTVELEGYDWSDCDVAEEGSLEVFREQYWCEISPIAPSVSANFRWIDNFEIISQVSRGNGRVMEDAEKRLVWRAEIAFDRLLT